MMKREKKERMNMGKKKVNYLVIVTESRIALGALLA